MLKTAKEKFIFTLVFISVALFFTFIGFIVFFSSKIAEFVLFLIATGCAITFLVFYYLLYKKAIPHFNSLKWGKLSWIIAIVIVALISACLFFSFLDLIVWKTVWKKNNDYYTWWAMSVTVEVFMSFFSWAALGLGGFFIFMFVVLTGYARTTSYSNDNDKNKNSTKQEPKKEVKKSEDNKNSEVIVEETTVTTTTTTTKNVEPKKAESKSKLKK